MVSVTAVAISTGAVLGKANPVQLIVMSLVELIVFFVSRCINRTFLQVPWWGFQIHEGEMPLELWNNSVRSCSKGFVWPELAHKW